MRNLTPEQEGLVIGTVTKPTFLVELQFDTTEYLSTNGDVTVDTVTYTGSDVGITGVSDWTSGTIKLVPNTSRVAEVIEGGWLNNPCKISLLPISNNRQLMEEGYVEELYAYDGIVQEDPILLLDGVLTAANISTGDNGTVNLTVSHKAFVGQWTPRLRMTNQFLNFLPEAGSQFTWEGDLFTLEAR